MMGCGIFKSAKTFLNRADLVELQKHPEEFHERHMKILQWMEDDLGFGTEWNEDTKLNWKKMQETEQLLSWEEAWQREQELVHHPSLVHSCESRISCITLVNENKQRFCSDE